MSRKRVKLSRKSKRKKEDKSKIVEDQQTKEINKTPDETHLLDLPTCAKKKEKSARHVHVAFLPEKYEPLVEDDISDKPREDNAKKRQDKYKKIRKVCRCCQAFVLLTYLTYSTRDCVTTLLVLRSISLFKINARYSTTVKHYLSYRSILFRR